MIVDTGSISHRFLFRTNVETYYLYRFQNRSGADNLILSTFNW
jgi:hypothetical protein